MRFGSYYKGSLILFVLLTVGCASPYIGKYMPAGNYNRLEGTSGTHVTNMKDAMAIKYDWEIIAPRNKLHISGRYTPATTNTEFADILRMAKDDPRRKQGSLRFHIFFLDGEYKILEVEYITKWIGSVAAATKGDPYTFDAELKYDPSYRYIVFANAEIRLERWD